jgi:hypothetical protein
MAGGRLSRQHGTTRPELTPTHADRRAWRPWLDCALCKHPHRACYVGTAERPPKPCGGSGAVLAAGPPRRPQTNAGRAWKCQMPARLDRASPTGTAPRQGLGR